MNKFFPLLVIFSVAVLLMGIVYAFGATDAPTGDSATHGPVAAAAGGGMELAVGAVVAGGMVIMLLRPRRRRYESRAE